jgi:hypothetical protein
MAATCRAVICAAEGSVADCAASGRTWSGAVTATAADTVTSRRASFMEMTPKMGWRV